VERGHQFMVLAAPPFPVASQQVSTLVPIPYGVRNLPLVSERVCGKGVARYAWA
jgi:hypothetical protein